MSEAIQCDRCERYFYKDSRSDKEDYASLTMDYVNGHTRFHLCRKCVMETLPFLLPEEEYGYLTLDDETSCEHGHVFTDREYALLGMAYKVCCPMCDEKACVKWSERCDARKWFEKKKCELEEEE